MDFHIGDFTVARRKISDMRDAIDDMMKTYVVLCESAQSEAPGWQADSRQNFEKKMQGFRDACEKLRVRAEGLFDAQGRYFDMLEKGEDEYNN